MTYESNPNPFIQIANSVSKSANGIWFRVVIEFTQAIAKRMAECGINRTQLAKRLDVHPSFITKILKGDTNISVETIAKLTHALNCEFHICMAPKESLIGEGFAPEPESGHTIAAGKPAAMAVNFYNCFIGITNSLFSAPQYA